MTFTTLFPTVVYTTNLNPCEQVRSEMLNYFETYVLDNCIGDDDDANNNQNIITILLLTIQTPIIMRVIRLQIIRTGIIMKAIVIQM